MPDGNSKIIITGIWQICTIAISFSDRPLFIKIIASIAWGNVLASSDKTN
ncbi:hypothetical protein [Borreliella bavariensis]|nr:hypothetical protein [Borreliella bavariensis]